MKIDTEITIDTLVAINHLWTSVDFNDTTKTERSIMQFVAEKFIKKTFSRFGKKQERPFKITLYYFEAVTLEKILRITFQKRYHKESEEFNLVLNYCNQVHQKLA